MSTEPTINSYPYLSLKKPVNLPDGAQVFQTASTAFKKIKAERELVNGWLGYKFAVQEIARIHLDIGYLALDASTLGNLAVDQLRVDGFSVIADTRMEGDQRGSFDVDIYIIRWDEE